MAANVILLVNSDTSERSSLQLALQLRGYSVLTAVNSSGAIAAARQPKRIRLLLVDARSTGQQVESLVEQMSKGGQESAVLVIGDDDTKRDSSRFQTIRRPFTRSELARKISLLIGREK